MQDGITRLAQVIPEKNARLNGMAAKGLEARRQASDDSGSSSDFPLAAVAALG